MVTEPGTENKKTSRILIVEDDEINQMVSAHILKKQGYQVETAFDGVEAIQKIAVSSFDLVLLDLEMPNMDGYETSLKIRETFTYIQLPIIVLSGHQLEDVAERLADANVNDFLLKPFDASTLRAMVVKHLPA